jgi:nitroreductase
MADSRRLPTNDAIVAYLRSRRSIPAAQLGDPGPDEEALSAILTIAARVPDHGKLAPWRFITYDRAARRQAASWLAARAQETAEGPDLTKRINTAQAFAAPPLVVAVVSSPVESLKIPLWEQQLSSGAVCLNLVHAAHAYGFAAQWLTGWYAYDGASLSYLGLREGERPAGFIHIGVPAAPSAERDRPDISAIMTAWRPGREG